MMLKLWRWYQQCLAVHPVKTQVISSGILWGLGDIGAQAITHRSSSLKSHHNTQVISILVLLNEYFFWVFSGFLGFCLQSMCRDIYDANRNDIHRWILVWCPYEMEGWKTHHLLLPLLLVLYLSEGNLFGEMRKKKKNLLRCTLVNNTHKLIKTTVTCNCEFFTSRILWNGRR